MAARRGIPLTRGRYPGRSRPPPAGPVALHHPAAGSRIGQDPLRRVRAMTDRRAGHDRHADRADDREHRPALEGLWRDPRQLSGPAMPTITYDAKYGIRDYRGGGRSSARETAMRVSRPARWRARCVPGVTIRGALVQMGPHKIDRANWDWDEVEQQPVLLPRRRTAAKLGQTISTASARPARRSARSSRWSPKACRPGWARRSTASSTRISPRALMSINAVKGVEIGAGFACGAH